MGYHRLRRWDMGVLLAFGSQLPYAILNLSYGSTNEFSTFFWDDEQAVLPTDLTGSTATIEVDAPTTTTFATGIMVSGTNEVQFIINASTSTVTWDNVPFRVVLTKAGSRYVIASGKVRVHK
jgi:hypothetical protein